MRRRAAITSALTGTSTVSTNPGPVSDALNPYKRLRDCWNQGKTEEFESILASTQDVLDPNFVVAGRPLLALAAMLRSVKGMEILLARGAYLSGPGPVYPLLEAHELTPIRYLLQAGATPNIAGAFGLTPLMRWALEGRHEIMEELLLHRAKIDSQDDDGRTALWFACNRRRTKCVKVLLEGGANPNLPDHSGRPPAMQARNLATTMLLNDYRADFVTCECWKRFPSRSEQLEKFFELQPPPINSGYLFHLWYYWRKSRVEDFEGIIETKKDVIASSARGPNGSTLIWYAASLGSIRALSHLAGTAAELNTPSLRNGFWNSPLHQAALQSRTKAIRWLLQRGADPNARDSKDHTPLMVAAKAGDCQAIEALVSGGANPNITDRWGGNALYHARKRKSKRILELLQAQT